MREPQLCPNPECRLHYRLDPPSRRRWYLRDGSFISARRGRTVRFRCRECGKRFSEATFALEYYAKKRMDVRRLRKLLVSGVSVRGCARQLNCAASTVSRWVIILCRQSIAAHAALWPHHGNTEALVADGFQSFWVSQYHPNNFNLLLGSESQYVYALTSVSLKRSGRMSKAQRRRRDLLESQYRSDPKGVERSFAVLVGEAVRLWDRQRTQGLHPCCVITTDEHQSYPRAILPYRFSTDIQHHTVSSRQARTGQNPLFAVNYIDREIRKDLAEHHRETVCFARHASHSIARMWVYLVWHNLEKPFRISPRQDRSHAEVSGVPRIQIVRQRSRILSRRAFFHRSRLCESQRRDWLQLHWTPEHENRRNPRVTPSYAAI
ncbi:MAG: hypothetical protein ACOC4I_02325 [Spirochaetota bacterium]